VNKLIALNASINVKHAKMDQIVFHAKEIIDKMQKIIVIVYRVFMIQEIK
jgi:hypothetical protein